LIDWFVFSVKKLPKTTAKRSLCPVATTLDVVGDKWSLLIVRDIGIFGYHRNKDFQNRKEGIPSNILASRLKSLHESGLLRKERYQDNPPRYEYHLTPAGEALLPVVREMAVWSAEHVAGIRMPKIKKANP
jgi:DNA-binding HxlR family transcriptional regulator